MRIAILDDLERAALDSADWSALGEVEEIVVLDRHVDDRDELSALLAGFDVVVAQRERTAFDRDLLERLPDLRLLVSTGPRNAAIDVRSCEELGITVCATSNEGSPVVEQAWALILGSLRNVAAHDTSMRAGGWSPILGRGLEGRTLGLLGLGRTGTRMARIGAAMGMRVIAWSQNLTVEDAAERGAVRVEERELYAEADVLSVHLLLSGRTRGLVGEEQLRLMKPDAVLVNTSRGPIVDEAALLRACRDGLDRRSRPRRVRRGAPAGRRPAAARAVDPARAACRLRHGRELPRLVRRRRGGHRRLARGQSDPPAHVRLNDGAGHT